ncbi:MAG: leucine-rich repeat domain-containing protein, partial [Oscillospiraceae bacterium]|nr:leucine-rich repeat domain-containing protein [Oscillospiraceae bacterium]
MVKIGTCTDKDIVIPEKSPAGDTVTLIGEYALMSLKADSVTLINYNYEVDERAFQYGKFKTLNIIGGNPVIGDSAFSSCDDIKTITFQNCKIETVEYSFMSCGKDAVLTFDNCTGYIDERAFQYGDFESISFKNCDLELDDSSFSSCDNVKSLTISDSTI